jgi:GWxTD domain-containing protein
MKSVLHLSVLCVLLAGSVSFPFEKDTTFFNLDLLNFYSPDSSGSRLDVYIEIPFGNIEFKKSKKTKSYSSRIDFGIEVFPEGRNEPVLKSDFTEVVTTEKTSIEYLSKNSQIVIRNVFLEPGDYEVKVTSKEINSKRIFGVDKKISMRNFRESPLTLSDVMVVARLSEKDGKKYITPSVSRNAGSLDTAYLFFFVYLNKDADSLKVECNILNSKDEIVYSTSDSIIVPVFNNQIIFSVPTNMLADGEYKIKIDALTPWGSASTLSSMDYKWSNLRVSLDKIEDAIDQLQYIATDSDMKKIRAGKTKAEKQRRFIEFWKSKDPSPNTVRNEVMDEYYRRIEYANKNYSTKYTAGWRTDMGMVYIIFGLPDNVERHPYEMDSKPYEIWDYYDLNRQFIFVDESGFGDYRLITPIWERFR